MKNLSKIPSIVFSVGIGLITGSWSTYWIVKRHQQRVILDNDAAMQYMHGSQLLELIAIAESHDPKDLNAKLNYELARTISYARAHKNDNGEAGYWMDRILRNSMKQRATNIYQAEEVKFNKDISQPQPIQ